MPWLVHAFAPDYALFLVQKIFNMYPPVIPAIAAFGVDGHLETKESNLALKMDADPNYPFIHASMDKEVHQELVIQKNWDPARLTFAARYGSV